MMMFELVTNEKSTLSINAESFHTHRDTDRHTDTDTYTHIPSM